jgi:pimeloyl-ACP methyl ester carboxylesterase
MPASARLVAAAIRPVGLLAPALSARLALSLFFTTAPRMSVRDADRATHEDARRERIRVRDADRATHEDARHERIRVRDAEVVVYRWGRGERSVLLLHGWQGRASQFAPLVRELVADGFRVVSFDAPGHGDSGGRRTDVRDWVALADTLQRTDGPFHALVGHSFGGFAALTAVRTTVPAPHVAVIAGASSATAYLSEFARSLQLTPAVAARFERRFAARFGLDAEGIAAAFDAVRDPLPRGTDLLVVHDRADRRMPDTDALRLHAAHAGRSRLLRTEGLGHNRVLQDDAVLDAVQDLVRDRGASTSAPARRVGAPALERVATAPAPEVATAPDLVLVDGTAVLEQAAAVAPAPEVITAP